MEKSLTECNKVELCEQFNTHVKEIMYYVECYNPDDLHIEFAASSLRKLIRWNPLDLLWVSHDTLWDYREQIRSTNKEFFLKEDLITKFNVREHNKKVKEVDIEYIINQVKNTWSEFAEDEQRDIIARIKTLLKISAAYRILQIEKKK